MASSIHQENIYDSKINEERPKINKSLGKHSINNNLHLSTRNNNLVIKESSVHLIRGGITNGVGGVHKNQKIQVEGEKVRPKIYA